LTSIRWLNSGIQASRILNPIVPVGDDQEGVLSWVLR
jgi:hypothetical protein